VKPRSATRRSHGTDRCCTMSTRMSMSHRCLGDEDEYEKAQRVLARLRFVPAEHKRARSAPTVPRGGPHHSAEARDRRS